MVLVSVLLLRTRLHQDQRLSLAAGMILAGGRAGPARRIGSARLSERCGALPEFHGPARTRYRWSSRPIWPRFSGWSATTVSELLIRILIHRHGPVRRSSSRPRCWLPICCWRAGGAATIWWPDSDRDMPRSPAPNRLDQDWTLWRHADCGQHPVRIAEFRQRRLQSRLAVPGGAVPWSEYRPARQACRRCF